MTSSGNKPDEQDNLASITVYTAAPWESAVVVLRVTGPAEMAGYRIIQGNHGPQISVDAVADSDLIVIQRDFPRFWKEYLQIITAARRAGKPVIYDLDDLLVEIPQEHSHHGDYAGEILAMLYAIVDADMVTTSSQYLVEYLRELNPDTRLVKNYLNDELWEIKPPRAAVVDAKKVVVGYMGGQTHQADLEHVAAALIEVHNKLSDRVMYKFWGVQPPAELLNLPSAEWHPLNQEDYASFARYFSRQECDILIAPLANNEFNRGKSAIKFLEYSTLGAAGVFSDLPPYQSIVKPGENGFLAGDLADWEVHLTTLIENPTLRNQIASAAQRTVQEEWRLSSNYDVLVETYQSAINKAAINHPSVSEREKLLQVISHAEDYQAQIEERLFAAENQLKDIRSSRSWRVLQQLQNLRLKIFPK